MSVIKALNRKRKITISRIADILNAGVNAQTDITKVPLFEIMYENLEKSYEEFKEFHNDIVGNLVNDDDYVIEDKIRFDTETFYYKIKLIYTEIQTPLVNPVTSSTIRLPKLNISTFNGNIKDWPTFFDMYTSLIHNNPNLQNIEKFQYLISYLQGEPLNLIKNIVKTDANYPIAFDTLEHRYQNVRKLATFYWNSIHNAPALKNSDCKLLRSLLNTFEENITSLTVLKYPTDTWCFILFNLLLQKLDETSRTEYEVKFSDVDTHTYKELFQFLESRCKGLESASQITNTVTKTSKFDHKSKLNSMANTTSSGQSDIKSCKFCKEKTHIILQCQGFLEKNPSERFSLAKQNKLCINCLRGSHLLKDCKSLYSCRTCQKRHHTLLHFNSSNNVKSQQTLSAPNQIIESEPENSNESASNSNKVSSFSNSIKATSVILSTAIVEIEDRWGAYQKIRILLDPGSQANIISEKCANRLGLTKSQISTQIYGLNHSHNIAKSLVNCTIKPITKCHPLMSFEAVILPKICNQVPSVELPCNAGFHINKLNLADNHYYKPGKIDLLFGAELFPNILMNGRVLGENGNPSAIETIFGWIIMGKVNPSMINSNFLTSYCTTMTTNFELKQFWELESCPEFPEKQILSFDENKAMQIFKDEYSRNSDGSFVVSLPFKTPNPDLGETYAFALKRFLKLEATLIKNPQIYNQYSNFINEYLQCNYLSCVDENDHNARFYLPHHCVMRPDKTTTKLRVVFDGSFKGSKGIALNETLLTGPKLQADLFAILLKLRLFPIIMIADIKQMYLQIHIKDEHKDYQRLLWRFNSTEPIKEYKLNRVTFGLNCSPFLAIRTLHELAILNDKQYSLASNILLNNTFVDDIIVGTNSIDSALRMQQELIKLLNSGGFELRKWASNKPELLLNFKEDECQMPLIFSENNDFYLKVLGLQWNPKFDSFSYSYNNIVKSCTKRNILSEIARLYDPLGFISPITLLAKVFMQKLWILKIDWDEEPPQSFQENWFKFKNELSLLANISIPRYVSGNQNISVQLHGFSDASERGYSAAIYLRLENINDINSYLIISKTKVAPLKTISIPRLELCGAVLLAKTFKYLLNTYNKIITIENSYAYCDSEIVLSWLRSSPHEHKTFVANRISSIHENLPNISWFHISSGENPADLASRGVFPNKLVNNSLWFHGPCFLTKPMSDWNLKKGNSQQISAEVLERKAHTFTITINNDNILTNLINKFSSIEKIQRILVFCLRFIQYSRNDYSLKTEVISSTELHNALLILIKHEQQLKFSDLIRKIHHNELLPKPFRKLALFIDESGYLRVGGRLRHANIPFDTKHPYLLPSKGRLTELIIENMHKKFLHPGFNSLKYLLRQQFWIFSSRNAIYRVLSNCRNCFRAKPKEYVPYMGDLPAFRITQLKAFVHSSVDYAGPFFITLSRSRGSKKLKAYVCIFVCCATKAIHIELASDLTSEAFLAAFNRFISRRGKCAFLHSDCGTNFKGAYTLMQEYAKQACETLYIKWSFQPPSAPHFNGLVEAGVKSVKTHLYRVVGEQLFTYEELYTLLTKIEAILNSRPLTAQSSDPNDLNPLTPGHFLTMEPLNSIPCPDLSEIKIKTLSRWQLLQRLHCDFWKRWHSEYLNTLQQRSKWLKNDQDVKINTLVLIKDNLKTPFKWLLGRIVLLHPGKDNKVRVATVRTVQGLIKRPLIKLCPLPNQT